MSNLSAFETKSAAELKELVEMISRKGSNEEIRFLAWVIYKYVTIA